MRRRRGPPPNLLQLRLTALVGRAPSSLQAADGRRLNAPTLSRRPAPLPPLTPLRPQVTPHVFAAFLAPAAMTAAVGALALARGQVGVVRDFFEG